MNTFCFSFYSYKGGSGRSTTAINTAFHLTDVLEADPEHPILLVDADVESAGLTYFFNHENKFTDCFDQAIHTSKFFNESTDPLSVTAIKNEIFGVRKIKFGLTNESALEEEWNQKFPKYPFVELFTGVQLMPTQIAMFKTIVGIFHPGIQNGREFQNEKEFQIYNLWSSNLSILINNLRNARTPSDKEGILEKFLPTTQLLDVSHFFSKAAGTIMLLGVDIHYLGKRIKEAASSDKSGEAIQRGQQLSHDSFNLAQKLVDACNDFGYRAVIFDCGSGTQTTAEMIHAVSDVIVYCMRPTLQFIRGTHAQLSGKYAMLKNKIGAHNTNNYKPVILLPTSIPSISKMSANGIDALKNESFSSIRILTETREPILDCTFCTPETALAEVEYFKWREGILGSSYVENCTAEVKNIVERYSCVETMPDDAKRAFKVYRELAEALKKNAEGKYANKNDEAWED